MIFRFEDPTSPGRLLGFHALLGGKPSEVSLNFWSFLCLFSTFLDFEHDPRGEWMRIENRSILIKHKPEPAYMVMERPARLGILALSPERWREDRLEERRRVAAGIAVKPGKGWAESGCVFDTPSRAWLCATFTDHLGGPRLQMVSASELLWSWERKAIDEGLEPALSKRHWELLALSLPASCFKAIGSRLIDASAGEPVFTPREWGAISALRDREELLRACGDPRSITSRSGQLA